MLRGRASHHVKVPDHCLSVCDISLTETGKGSGPVHNPEIISAACYSYSHSILFSSFLQDPHLTVTVADVHPWQHLKLLITVPPTLQRLHPLLYFHISSRKYSLILLLPFHTSLEIAGAPKGIQEMQWEGTDGQPKNGPSSYAVLSVILKQVMPGEFL